LFITLGYCRIWKTAVQIFEKLFDDEVFQLIVDFSNLYASQNNRHNFSITVAELKTFFGILLLSGYHKLPREGMYWSLDEDIGVEVVSKAMSRNRFREIKRNLHLVDNNDAPNATDKMFKVRNLADILMRKFCQWNVFHGLISVDESMVKYLVIIRQNNLFVANRCVLVTRIGLQLVLRDIGCIQCLALACAR
jgi:hypothetical protein